MTRLINISELCKNLNLVNPITKKPLTHILRYWEKEFNQIKPKKINNRRYYSSKDVEIIKIIKTLLKDNKMTIRGVKNMLSSQIKKLDDDYTHSLKTNFYKTKIKYKSEKILKKLKQLNHYGKKNSS